MMSSDYKIAKLAARTQLESQLLNLVSDPMWSSILGFVAVHELRKHDMVGPVADDILYAGIIAANVARAPALARLAGESIKVVGETASDILAPLLAGAAGAAVGAKLATRVARAPLPMARQLALPAGRTPKGFWARLGSFLKLGGPFQIFFVPKGVLPPSEEQLRNQ